MLSVREKALVLAARNVVSAVGLWKDIESAANALQDALKPYAEDSVIEVVGFRLMTLGDENGKEVAFKHRRSVQGQITIANGVMSASVTEPVRWEVEEPGSYTIVVLSDAGEPILFEKVAHAEKGDSINFG